MSATANTQETTDEIFKVKFHYKTPFRLYADSMSDEEFFEFCQMNNDLRIERTAKGQLIIMAPTGSETGHFNSEIHGIIWFWNRNKKLGYTFDSSTGFKLPNGAERSPDTAWIIKDRWEALSLEQREKFAPITPDFVLELRSKGQSLSELREKMDEYMECGCRLGWLMDPQNRRTYVYSENGEIQTVSFDEVLSGGELMPDLEVRWSEEI
jgi:Uma2 family endonuclease